MLLLLLVARTLVVAVVAGTCSCCCCCCWKVRQNSIAANNPNNDYTLLIEIASKLYNHQINFSYSFHQKCITKKIRRYFFDRFSSKVYQKNTIQQLKRVPRARGAVARHLLLHAGVPRCVYTVRAVCYPCCVPPRWAKAAPALSTGPVPVPVLV